MCLFICLSIHACAHTHTHIHICICVHTHVCTHTHAYTHIYFNYDLIVIVSCFFHSAVLKWVFFGFLGFDLPGFLAGSNFLLPWDITLQAVKEKWPTVGETASKKGRQRRVPQKGIIQYVGRCFVYYSDIFSSYFNGLF